MLTEKIQNDLKDAMRAKDEQKLSIIRMLKSAIQYYEINKGGAGYEATDEDVIDVVGKERILTGAYQSYTVEEKERGLLCHEFYIPEVQACIYYVAVATNPFSDTNIVVRADGVYTEEEEYNSKIVVLDHVRYEVQGATEGLAERIYQRDHQGLLKNPKYDQDIHNLRSITDSYEVDFLVKQKIKKEKMGAHTNS